MRKLMLVSMAVVVVAALISVVWYVRWGTTTVVGSDTTSPVDAQPSTSAAFSMVCAAYGDESHCNRVASEASRHPKLTDAQRTEAIEAQHQLEIELMSFGGICVTCSGPPQRRDATTDDASQLVALLEAKGLKGSTARIASSTDPAPEGKLMYAVPVTEHACVVGHFRDLPGGGGGSVVLAKLPNGRCLTDQP